MMFDFISFVVVGLYLLVLAVWDVFTFDRPSGEIPSFMSTTFVLLCVLISGGGFVGGVLFGLFGFLIGLLFVDLRLFEGLADWKVLVGCCAFLGGLLGVLVFGCVVAGVGCLFKLGWSKWVRGWGDVPFLVVFVVSWLAVVVGGMF